MMIYLLTIITVFLGIISILMRIIAYKLTTLHKSIENIDSLFKSIKGRVINDKTKEAFIGGALNYFLKRET
jgi:hypothetical protein